MFQDVSELMFLTGQSAKDYGFVSDRPIKRHHLPNVSLLQRVSSRIIDVVGYGVRLHHHPR